MEGRRRSGRAGDGVGSRGLCVGQGGLDLSMGEWRCERWGQAAGGPEPTGDGQCRSCRSRAASSGVAGALLEREPEHDDLLGFLPATVTTMDNTTRRTNRFCWHGH